MKKLEAGLCYCDSCRHVLEEKGIKIDVCNIMCATSCQDLTCANCGETIKSCPNLEGLKKTQLRLVESALKNPNLTVVCFTAPSIRASITEEFCGGNVQDGKGKLVSALKKLGFDYVFDMNIAADFTVVEEAHEFVKRYKEQKNLPMMTSCCPGWVNYVTKTYKEFIPNLSTCKSPQQMFGALLNTYFIERLNKESTDIFVVSIVPCLAKKLEAGQESNNSNIGHDVDAAITTSELVEMIKDAGIDFSKLEDCDYDQFFGSASAAGTIFGNTGGVMEAVLRTVGDCLEEKETDEAMACLVRGLGGVRRATISFGKNKIRVVVVSGIKNASEVLENIKNGKERVDFLEVMACEGGCVGGGGQPRHMILEIPEYTRKRAEVLYKISNINPVRKSHLNPAIKNVYDSYLGSIGSKKAIKLLHRKYKR